MPDELVVKLTILEATEVAIAASVALDNEQFMSLPDTNRNAIMSGMRKIYAAQPANTAS